MADMNKNEVCVEVRSLKWNEIQHFNKADFASFATKPATMRKEFRQNLRKAVAEGINKRAFRN